MAKKKKMRWGADRNLLHKEKFYGNLNSLDSAYEADNLEAKKKEELEKQSFQAMLDHANNNKFISDVPGVQPTPGTLAADNVSAASISAENIGPATEFGDAVTNGSGPITPDKFLKDKFGNLTPDNIAPITPDSLQQAFEKDQVEKELEKVSAAFEQSILSNPSTLGQQEMKNTLPEDKWNEFLTLKKEYDELDKRTLLNRFKNARTYFENETGFKPMKKGPDETTASAMGKDLYNFLQGTVSNIGTLTMALGSNHVYKDALLNSSNSLTSEESDRKDALEARIAKLESEALAPVFKDMKEQDPILRQQYDDRIKAYSEKQIAGSLTDQDIKDASFDKESERLRRTMYEDYAFAVEDAEASSLYKGARGFFDGKLSVLQTIDDINTAILANELSKKDPETYTDSEKRFLENLVKYNDHTQKPVSTSSIHDTFKGVRHSAEFMGEMFLTGGTYNVAKTSIKSAASSFAKSAAKNVASTATERSAIGAAKKILGETTELAAKSLMLPGTHREAAKDTYSDIQGFKDAEGNLMGLFSDEQKLAAGVEMKKGMLALIQDNELIEKQITELNKEISRLNSPEASQEDITSSDELAKKVNLLNNKMQKNYSDLYSLNVAHDLIIDDEGNVKRRGKTYGEGVLKHGVNNLKEYYAEMKVGAFFDDALRPLGTKFLDKVSTNKTADAIIKSSQRGADSFNRMVDNKLGTTGMFAKTLAYGKSSAGMINSIPGEFVEEMFINLTPAIDTDYADSFSELGSMDFYTNVGISTLLLGAGTRGIGALGHKYKLLSDKNYADEYKDFKFRENEAKKRFIELDRDSNTSDRIKNQIALATLGTTFDEKAYYLNIENLRNGPHDPNDFRTQDERNKAADILEKNAFLSLASQSFSTGTDKYFERALRNIRDNKSLNEETNKSAEKALKRMSELRTVINDNASAPNLGRIISLTNSMNNGNETISDARKEIELLSKQVSKDIEDYSKANQDATSYSVDDIIGLHSMVRKGVKDADRPMFNDKMDFAARLMDSSSAARKLLELVPQTELLEEEVAKINMFLKYETDPSNKKAIIEREEANRGKQTDAAEITPELAKQIIAREKDAEESKTDTAEEVSLSSGDTKEGKVPVKKTRSGKRKSKRRKKLNENRKKAERIEREANILAKQNSEDKNEEVAEVEETSQEDPEIYQDDNEASQESLQGFIGISEEELKNHESVNIFSGEVNQSTVPDPIQNAIDSELAEEEVVFNEVDPIIGIETSSSTTPSEFADILNANEDSSVDLELFAPMPFDIENKPLQQKFENAVNSAVNAQPTLSFEGLVAGLFNSDILGPLGVDKYFHYLGMAWNNITGDNISSNEFLDIYHRFYPSATILQGFNLRDNQISLLQDVPVGTQATNPSSIAPGKVLEPVVKIEELSNITRTSHTAKNYSEVGAKSGGQLGLDYIETSEGTKVDTTNEVNTNAIPFLDPRNFKIGSEVELRFDIETLLDPNSVVGKWSNEDAPNLFPGDEKPTRETIKFRDRLLEIFSDSPKYNNWDAIEEVLQRFNLDGHIEEDFFSNEELLGILPVGTVNNGYTDKIEQGALLKGGLPNNDWFNNSNVVLYEDSDQNPLVEERASRIAANKQINMQIRRDILKGKNSLKLPVAENRQVAINELVIGYSQATAETPINSLASMFGEDVAEFEKYVGMGIFNLAGELVSSDGKGVSKRVVVDGNEVSPDRIINHTKIIQLLNKGVKGNNAYVVKVSEDAQGPLYEIFLLQSDHPNHVLQGLQKWFGKSGHLNGVYFKILGNSKFVISSAKKQKFLENFKEIFGYEFNQVNKDLLEKLSGAINTKGRYSHNNSSAVYEKKYMQFVPDFYTYNSDREFIDAVINTPGDVRKVHKTIFTAKGMHTDIVHTPIENNGSKIYVHKPQPYIMFDYASENVQKQAGINTKEVANSLKLNANNAEKKAEQIEKDINSGKITERQAVRAELEARKLRKEAETIKKQLEKLEEGPVNNPVSNQVPTTPTEIKEEENQKPGAEVLWSVKNSLLKDLESIGIPFISDMIAKELGVPTPAQIDGVTLFDKASELDTNGAIGVARRAENAFYNLKTKNFGNSSIYTIEYQRVGGEIVSLESSDKSILLGDLKQIVINDLKDISQNNIPERVFTESDNIAIREEVVSMLLSTINIDEKTSIEDMVEAAPGIVDIIVGNLQRDGFFEEAEYVLENVDEILKIDGEFDNSLREYLTYLFEVDPEDSQDNLTTEQENEKSYSKGSQEVDPQKSISFKAKVLLAGIKDNRKDSVFGNIMPNFPPRVVLNAMKQIMAKNNSNDINDIIKDLELTATNNPTEFGFYSTIAYRLKGLNSTNQDVVNEIIYNMFQAEANMRFVMWKQKPNGVIEVTDMDANSKNPQYIKSSMWVENAKQSPLVELYEGIKYRINGDVLEELRNLHSELKNVPVEEISPVKLERFLDLVGIKLKPQTYQHFFSKKKYRSFDLSSSLTEGNESITAVILDNIEKVYAEGNPVTFSNNVRNSDATTFNFLLNRNSRLRDLIDMDNSFEFHDSGTLRIAGKSINTYQQNNPITNKVTDIKEGIKEYISNLNNPNIPEEDKLPKIIKDLASVDITTNNVIVQEIINNPLGMVDYFDTFLVSGEALKEAGSKTREDMEVTKLSEKDSLITSLGFHFGSEGKYVSEKLDEQYQGSLSFRKGHASFPTISDSSQLPYMKTIFVDVTRDHLSKDTGVLSNNILDYFIDKMIVGDMLRIVDYTNKVGDSGTSVVGYDAGAQFITSMTSLNGLLIDYGDAGKKRSLIYGLIDMVERNSDKNLSDPIVREAFVRDFISRYADDIRLEINRNIQYEADKYFNKNGTGILQTNSLVTKGKVNVSENGVAKDADLVAYDFVINNFIQQREIQTMFAGDIAYYFTDNLVSSDSESNGVKSTLKHRLPKIDVRDMIRHYYPLTTGKQYREIVSAIESKNKDFLSENYPDLLFSPDVNKSLGLNNDIEILYEKQVEVASKKLNGMFKKVQNNLSKRLKGQISPGNQLVGSTKDTNQYFQLMVNDVTSPSETFAYLAEVEKGRPLSKDELKDIEKYLQLNGKWNKTLKESTREKELLSKLESLYPNMSAYLSNADTDAQEYTTWQENLNQLRDQGRLSRVQYQNLKTKLENQEKDLNTDGYIKPENKLSLEEMQGMIMQVSKPLYSGMINYKEGGHNMSRYIYIKTSSFPLIPELTNMFPKLESLRKNVGKIQQTLEGAENNTYNVRIAYGKTGVKVGGIKRRLDMKDLETGDISYQDILASGVTLDRKNFYIQQDKPFKSDKNAYKGLPDRVVRATQFEKILLGDGISTIEDKIFDANLFDSSLLRSFGIDVTKDNKISGTDLKKIYNKLYAEEQKILRDDLLGDIFNKNVDFSKISSGDVSVMENLSKLLKNEVSRKQDKQALDLVYHVKVSTISNGKTIVRDVKMSKNEIKQKGLIPYKASFKMPLHTSINSRKFETAFNTMISKRMINLTMSGFASPVASQEGFDFKGLGDGEYTIEKLVQKGLILTENFDPKVGLKSQTNSDGKLTHAQVFLPNKIKIFNNKKGIYEYINLKDFVKEGTNIIDFSKLSPEVIQYFSFRIPTSSHQSGAVIEVVGFLPHSMGDLMIVPRDHTTQIGEDFDIDTRYVYSNNIIKDRNGVVRKITMDDVDSSSVDNYERSKENYLKAKQDLWSNFYVNTLKEGTEEEIAVLKNPMFDLNKDLILDIKMLEDILTKQTTEGGISEEDFNIVNTLLDGEVSIKNIEKLIKRLRRELIPSSIVKEERQRLQEEYRVLKNSLENSTLKDSFNNSREQYLNYISAKKQKADYKSVIENNYLAMYKAVFTNPDKRVAPLVSKVLSTGFSENSAAIIDNATTTDEKYFNILSLSTQKKVMRMGADGKMGIGVHSNAVTSHSMLQQFGTPVSILKKVKGNLVPYNIVLGNIIFDGDLGNTFDKSNRDRISTYLMESQNSATDNQKLEIMGRRNENDVTIGVFSLMQLAGLESDGIKVLGLDKKETDISYASLFISQPIIREYVELYKEAESSTSKRNLNPDAADDYNNSPDRIAYAALKAKYGKKVSKSFYEYEREKRTNNINPDLLKSLTSKTLYDNLIPSETSNIDIQMAVLEQFEELRKASKTILSIQSLLNIEANGFGLSFFNVLDYKDSLLKMGEIPMATRKYKDYLKAFIKADEIKKGSKKGGILTKEENDILKSFEIYSNPLLDFVGTIENENGNLTYSPKSQVGQKIFNATDVAYSIGKELFPYEQSGFEATLDGVKRLIKGPDGTSKKEALDEKYGIMNEYKDYIYSGNRKLFPGDISDISSRLFFDNSENESLASYLNRLRNYKGDNKTINKRVKNLLSGPIFSHLRFDINGGGVPSTISYNNTENTPLESMTNSNFIESFMNSRKHLPPKADGTVVTEASLMKELLQYALLANQNEGATGFRNQLPISLFEKYGVTEDVSEKSRTGKDMQRVSRGVVDSIESMAKSFEVLVKNRESQIDELYGLDDADSKKMIDSYKAELLQENLKLEKEVKIHNAMYKKLYGGTEDVFLLKNREILGMNLSTMLYVSPEADVKRDFFPIQYVQHNPEKASKTFSHNSKAVAMLEENNLLTEGSFGEGIVSEFHTTDFLDSVVSIYDKNNVPTLFMRESFDISVNKYVRIPTLGSFGFNEYRPYYHVRESLVAENNPTKASYRGDRSFDLKALTSNTPGGKPVTEDFVKDAINTFEDSQYKPLFNFLSKALPAFRDPKIVISDNIPGGAKVVFNPETKAPTITINSALLKAPATIDNVQKVIAEELLHVITGDILNSQLTITDVNYATGEIKYRISPDSLIADEITGLIKSFEVAIKHFGDKYGVTELKNKIDAIGSGNRVSGTGIDDAAYRLQNIHEFIAGSFLKDGDFAKELSKVVGNGTAKSFLEHILEYILTMVNKLLPTGAIKNSELENVLINTIKMVTYETDNRISYLASQGYTEAQSDYYDKINIMKKYSQETYKTPVKQLTPIRVDSETGIPNPFTFLENSEKIPSLGVSVKNLLSLTESEFIKIASIADKVSGINIIKARLIDPSYVKENSKSIDLMLSTLAIMKSNVVYLTGPLKNDKEKGIIFDKPNQYQKSVEGIYRIANLLGKPTFVFDSNDKKWYRKSPLQNGMILLNTRPNIAKKYFSAGYINEDLNEFLEVYKRGASEITYGTSKVTSEVQNNDSYYGISAMSSNDALLNEQFERMAYEADNMDFYDDANNLPIFAPLPENLINLAIENNVLTKKCK